MNQKTKYVPLFERFVQNLNSEKEEFINESFFEEYVNDSSINNEEELKEHIKKNMPDAMNSFLKKHGIEYNPITSVEIDKKGYKGYINLESEPLTGDEIGFLKYGIEKVWLDFFSGSKYSFKEAIDEDEPFKFKPYIWSTLHYSYKHLGGGSNGCSFILPGEKRDDIWYDILGKKFITLSEAEKLEKEKIS